MVKAGDIILYPVVSSSWWLDRAIGAAEFLMGQSIGKTQYCHVAIYAGDGMTFEAKWPKTGKYKMDTIHPWEAWRINTISENQIELILEWAQDHLNEWYDLAALLTAGWIRLKHMEVCSEFVEDAAKWARLIPMDVKFLTPDQIPMLLPMTKIEEGG